jgi:hypothetical protein
MTRRRPAKIITRVIVFLLLGAIVNVAVAWGCAYFSTPFETVTCSDAFIRRLYGSNRLEPNRSWVVSTQHSLGYLRSIMHTVDRYNAFDRSSQQAWAAGWPMLAMYGWSEFDSKPDGCFLIKKPIHNLLGYRGIPFTPFWPGFAINMIFYAAILWVLFFAPGSVRRIIRRRRGLCPACAYPIGTSPVCTECGKPVTP